MIRLTTRRAHVPLKTPPHVKISKRSWCLVGAKRIRRSSSGGGAAPLTSEFCAPRWLRLQGCPGAKILLTPSSTPSGRIPHPITALAIYPSAHSSSSSSVRKVKVDDDRAPSENIFASASSRARPHAVPRSQSSCPPQAGDPNHAGVR